MNEQNNKDFTPDKDGINHINTYSKGRTQLGRELTNFAHMPFNHTDYGPFESIEGLWYWLKTGQVNNELRDLHGFAAKRQGSELASRNGVSVSSSDPEFQNAIKEGIRCKLRQNQHILKKMVETELPFTHYYWKGALDNPIIQRCPESDWMMQELETIRSLTVDWLQQKKKSNIKLR